MKVLLCCAAGMSTSLLVSRMKKSAQEQGIKCMIWAVPVDAVENQIHNTDVLLLGPHVRYMFPQFKKLGEERNVPVEVINVVDYGNFNGEKVLKLAQQMYMNQTKTG